MFMVSFEHTLIALCLLLLLALARAQSTVTGKAILVALNLRGLAYQDLTDLTLTLRVNLVDDGQQLVEQYTNVTVEERQRQNTPLATEAFAEAVQYGNAAASHVVSVRVRKGRCDLADEGVS